jgi:hypothetical protein
MRALFGVVSLLVVLAIVGILAKKQLQAVHNVGASLPPAQASTDGTQTAAPAASTVRAQSQQIQQRVVDDVNKALQQGADRNEAADK